MLYLHLTDATEKVLEAIRAGYGGVFEDGAVCDRRDHPNTRPLAACPPLGVPEPQKVESWWRCGLCKRAKVRKEFPEYLAEFCNACEMGEDIPSTVNGRLPPTPEPVELVVTGAGDKLVGTLPPPPFRGHVDVAKLK
jgi:hypothetical protein